MALIALMFALVEFIIPFLIFFVIVKAISNSKKSSSSDKKTYVGARSSSYNTRSGGAYRSTTIQNDTKTYSASMNFGGSSIGSNNEEFKMSQEARKAYLKES